MLYNKRFFQLMKLSNSRTSTHKNWKDQHFWGYQVRNVYESKVNINVHRNEVIKHPFLAFLAQFKLGAWKNRCVAGTYGGNPVVCDFRFCWEVLVAGFFIHKTLSLKVKYPLTTIMLAIFLRIYFFSLI